ncbi:MAG: hotdog fold domain-containing protein [Actinomycetia bacterium]|nr:hotdog fold domain-containing protein [Actinomycetes bacterium]
MADTLAIFRRLSRLPAGRWVFSRMLERKAPYFRTVRPQVRTLEPGHAEVVVPRRRAVENHIGTVHVIAAVNGLEAAMGLLAEATCPRGMRWIPKGMEVGYVAKASSDLLCVADSDPADWDHGGDVAVRVRAIRTDGTVAIEGTITVYVSAKGE